MFNLFAIADAETVSNKKNLANGAGLETTIRTATTTGKVQYTKATAKKTGIAERDRALFMDVTPLAQATGLFPVTCQVMGEDTSLVFVKGLTNEADALATEFRRKKGPHTTAERSDYLQEQKQFIADTLAERGVKDHNNYGDLATEVGNFLELSTNNSWIVLGGNADTSKIYEVGEAIYGVAVVGGQPILVTNETDDNTSIEQGLFFVVDPVVGFTQNNPSSSIAEIKTAGTPVYPLSFKEDKAKVSRTSTAADGLKPVKAAASAAMNVIGSLTEDDDTEY